MVVARGRRPPRLTRALRRVLSQLVQFSPRSRTPTTRRCQSASALVSARGREVAGAFKMRGAERKEVCATVAPAPSPSAASRIALAGDAPTSRTSSSASRVQTEPPARRRPDPSPEWRARQPSFRATRRPTNGPCPGHAQPPQTRPPRRGSCELSRLQSLRTRASPVPGGSQWPRSVRALRPRPWLIHSTLTPGRQIPRSAIVSRALGATTIDLLTQRVPA